MNSNSTRITLHAYLEHAGTAEKLALYRFLSPDERELHEKLPKTEGNPLALNETEASVLRHIHPTWISPFLRTLSEKEIGYFLAALEHARGHAIARELHHTTPLPLITPLAKLFLQKRLLGYLTAEIDDLLPLSFLPVSPLNTLLHMKEDDFAHLIDLLGLHDLSLEVRQIIDKQKLNGIYSALSESELTYLKILAQSVEPLSFPKMGIANWTGDPEKLRSLIRQRGANRLAKALYGQEASFIWYVLHKLDVERALTVKKLLSPLENSRATQILINQIIELTNYYKAHHG